MKIGVPELLVLLAIIVILFGPTQIPKLSKMFGESVRKFKEGTQSSDEEKQQNG
ncbi:MAG: twin-arginine translocase TatA/TatE family subunit [Solobacterium sp.]|nr:twin-arginine translocase TatA/TatE family subunit [Solobacterium sp.]